jgi:hypothetical protein
MLSETHPERAGDVDVEFPAAVQMQPARHWRDGAFGSISTLGGSRLGA